MKAVTLRQDEEEEKITAANGTTLAFYAIDRHDEVGETTAPVVSSSASSSVVVIEQGDGLPKDEGRRGRQVEVDEYINDGRIRQEDLEEGRRRRQESLPPLPHPPSPPPSAAGEENHPPSPPPSAAGEEYHRHSQPWQAEGVEESKGSGGARRGNSRILIGGAGAGAGDIQQQQQQQQHNHEAANQPSASSIQSLIRKPSNTTTDRPASLERHHHLEFLGSSTAGTTSISSERPTSTSSSRSDKPRPLSTGSNCSGTDKARRLSGSCTCSSPRNCKENRSTIRTTTSFTTTSTTTSSYKERGFGTTGQPPTASGDEVDGSISPVAHHHVKKLPAHHLPTQSEDVRYLLDRQKHPHSNIRNHLLSLDFSGPPSVRTGQLRRQHAVRMDVIRGSLLASLSINLLCGLMMGVMTDIIGGSLLASLFFNLLCGLMIGVMTGYVMIMLGWGFFARKDSTASSVLSPLTGGTDDESGTIYLSWIAFIVVAVYLLSIASFGIHYARKVSIAHLIKYFWFAALGIAPLVLVTASAFDFYTVSRSFVYHHWDGKALDGLRLLFCDEGAQAGGKCAAPICVPGGTFSNVTAWCQYYFAGATDCASIKAEATENADTWIYYMLLGAGLLGVLNLISLLVSMYLCIKLVTPSVIMTYANDNMSYLLILPAGCCFGISLYLFSHQAFSPDHTWFAATFMTSALLTIGNSLLSFLGGRLKRKPLMQACLISNLVVILLLITICSAGYMIAGALANQSTFYTIRRATDIACSIGLRGCCCCDPNSNANSNGSANRCPEWSKTEIIDMIAADFRIASLTALVAIIYEVGGLTTVYLLYQNLKNYHCEYI